MSCELCDVEQCDCVRDMCRVVAVPNPATESDICPATLAHGIGVYHCRLLGAHREHQAGDLRWTTP